MAQTQFPFVPLDYQKLPLDEQRTRAKEFEERMRLRRTVRHFSAEPVPLDLIESAIRVASRAPSGANQQPWHFVAVSDAETKRHIRIAAEAEEKESYEHRMPQEWLDLLKPLGTDWHKEFLEIAPYLIVVFRQDYGVTTSGDGTARSFKHYYANESVGLACGFLLAALHWMGLVTLTHTPSPMGFLSEILKRPKNEKPFLLIPVGYPAADATVPDIHKKPLEEILDFIR